MEDKLCAGLERLGIASTEAQRSSLHRYARMILDFNKGYNLMKAEDEDGIIVNHILDSLAAFPQLQKLAGQASAPDPELADIGSGGGCPGIPLAILFDGSCHISLVERMEKRVSFLRSVIANLGLRRVDVLAVQAERVAPACFDVALFRAFHPFDRKTTKTLLALVKRGGFLAAYKARSEKIAAEMEAVRDMIPCYQKIPLAVPFLEDHERNLVVVQKA